MLISKRDLLLPKVVTSQLLCVSSNLLLKTGDAKSQFALGWMYHEGKGVPQDYKTAVKWTRLAAEQGDADAQYNLGSMYRKGQGVLQDYKTARKWYRLSAEQDQCPPLE